MRVLVLSNLYPPTVLGGYELVCEGVVDRLRESGHDVIVLTSVGPRGGADEHVRRELSLYMRGGRGHQPYPLLRLKREWADNRVLERQPEWDVALVFHMFALAKSLLTALHERGPVGYVLADLWPAWDLSTDTWLGRLHPEGPPGTPSRGVRRLKYPSLVARTTAPLARLAGVPADWPDLFGEGHWWANSRWVLDELVLRKHLPLGGPRVIHHGVPLELFPFAPRSEPGLRMLYVGRITQAKGVDVALGALDLIPRSRLTLVGPLDPEFSDRHERASFMSPVPRKELSEIYRSHDIVLFPVTWNEPLGLVPLEAMATGIPVVATGTGGSAEYLEHERNCLLVAPGDAQGLADAVERMTADGALRQRLISEGRTTAERMSFARTAAAIEEATAALAGGRPVTAGEPYQTSDPPAQGMSEPPSPERHSRAQ
ncbi:MAG: glycosyltransferase family 4 protein [Solirubrobacterales bacterium]